MYLYKMKIGMFVWDKKSGFRVQNNKKVSFVEFKRSDLQKLDGETILMALPN